MSTLHGEYRRDERTGIRTTVSLALPLGHLDTTTVDVSRRGLAIKKPSNLDLEKDQNVSVVFNRLEDKTVRARIVRVGETHVGLQLEQDRLTDNDIRQIVRTAPWYARLQTATRRALWKILRRTAVLAANTVLRKPLLALYRPSFIFAVYGNERDVSAYYTPGMLRLIPPNILGGFIRHRHHRGLLVGSKFLESELAEDSDKVRTFLRDLQAEFPAISKIALVGRLPNFAMKAGIAIEPPFVDGSMGTRYMIWDVAQQMRNLPEFAGETSIVVLGGAGRIGNLVCEDLAQLFSTVVAFDPRYDVEETQTTASGMILRTARPVRLTSHKLFIGLTHHGDVVQELQSYLAPGSLIADDTHPSISGAVRASLAAQQIRVMKIVLTHDTFTTWPRMPAWSNRDIPGCLVEALVLLEQTNAVVDSFDTFSATAAQIGFRGKLVPPVDD